MGGKSDCFAFVFIKSIAYFFQTSYHKTFFIIIYS